MDFDATEQVNALAKLPPEPVKPEKRSAWNLVHTIPRAAVAESAAGAIEIGVMGARSLAQIRDATPEQRKQIDAEGVSGVSGKNDVSASLRNVAEDLRPDPATASKAEQIVFDLGRIVTKAIGYGVTLGPGAIPALAADEGLSEVDRLQRQGVDDATARDAGGVNAAATALGALIPVAGAGRGFTAANVGKVVGLAAASGPTTFMAQQKITSEILSRANYGDIAAQYDPLDPTGLALSTLAPLIFGGLHLRGGKVSAKAEPVHETAPVDQTPAAPKVADMPPEAVDAAMVHNLTLQQDVHESTHPVVGVAEVMRPHVTETPEFKAWFGESKVVDAEGSPLVVYHGTQTPGFDSFTRGKVPPIGGVRFGDAQGFYFTDNPGYASDYGDTVMPVYLSMKNPYIVPADQFDHTYVSATRRAELEAQGHDGIMAPEVDGGRFGEIVVFRPEQIKSAIGNSGRFDPNSASLTDPVPRIPPEVVDAAMVQNLRDAETRIVRSLPPSDSLALPPAPTADEVGRFGKVENIPLGMTRATQSRMEWGRFDAGDYAPPLVEGFSDIPLAVRKLDGEVLVFDGHHRTADAINRGETEMPMRVLEARDYAPEFAGRKPVPSTISDDDLMAELSAPPKPAREANAQSLDEKAQIDAEAEHFQLVQQAIEGRADSTVDMFDAHMRSVTDRVAAVEAAKPDAPVAIDAEGKRISTAEELDRARLEAAEGTDFELGSLDADLLRVAADCALTLG